MQLTQLYLEVLSAPMNPSHVLIADDSKMVRMMRSSLIGAAYPDAHITPAEDGDVALELLAQSAHDLVITDLNMPNMGGEELYQLTREKFGNGELTSMPMFIFCSATTAAIPSLDEICEQSGCTRLAKPFTVDQIENCVKDMLEASSPS